MDIARAGMFVQVIGIEILTAQGQLLLAGIAPG
jgi:hypothetical protein